MTEHPSAITIRAMEPDDLPAYNRIHNHPEVVLQTMRPPFEALSEIVERIANAQDERYLVAERGGAVVGCGDLRIFGGRRAHAAQLGLAVDPEHSGQGIGSTLLEALIGLGERWYGIRRFELKVYADNQRAIALYERFGFEREATHRQFAQRGGAYVDAYTMARLAQ